MSGDPILSELRSFVETNFLYMRPGFTLGDADRFLENRVLDSMAVMELVIHLRREYAIEVPESDILEANLGSLRAVADYVRERLPSREIA